MSQTYEGVALLAPVTVPYRRYSEHGASWFIGRALAEILRVTDLRKENVDGLAVASYSLAPDSVVTLAQHFDISLRWVEQLPMGGASAVIGMRRAARAIQAGDARIVVCLAGDAHKKGDFAKLIADFSRFFTQAVNPYGAGGPNGVFSMITRAYMETYGATREDFGRICIAQRENASHNPLALLREPLTMADYLAARPIAEPLHLYDCVMPCAGGEGFLMMSVERARSIGVPFVTVSAVEERHNSFRDDVVQLRIGDHDYEAQLYGAAGLAPTDMDFVQVYDDYPVIALMQLEALGFCKRGEGPKFLRTTPLTCDGGGLPMNTCGGQLSAGQAGYAGGHLGLTEAIRQLTDQPLGQPVPGARNGVVSGYGIVNYNRGISTAATILTRGAQ